MFYVFISKVCKQANKIAEALALWAFLKDEHGFEFCDLVEIERFFFAMHFLK